MINIFYGRWNSRRNHQGKEKEKEEKRKNGSMMRLEEEVGEWMKVRRGW